MTTTFRAACIQNTATRDIAANVAWICERMREAQAEGANFIALPETAGLIESTSSKIPDACYTEEQDFGLTAFRQQARELGVVVLVGSQLIKTSDGRIVNRSLLLDTRGEIVARYDKLHLFDIELSSGEFYRESDLISAGDKAVLAATPWGKLGMSICYDLRFAALYRALAQNGAQFIAIPSAFTHTTGKAHWHTLVRARAIETGCYVIAPNQCGHHGGQRSSWGHSLIVDPWGEILAGGGPAPGIIYADIDLSRVGQARKMIPSLQHGRAFEVVQFPDIDRV